jgi:peptidoglycan/LPS O-acetylase OafA/YrhL
MRVFTAGGAMHGETRGYRPDIDGLRAIAILSVVAFHGGVSFFKDGFVGSTFLCHIGLSDLLNHLWGAAGSDICHF